MSRVFYFQIGIIKESQVEDDVSSKVQFLLIYIEKHNEQVQILRVLFVCVLLVKQQLCMNTLKHVIVNPLPLYHFFFIILVISSITVVSFNIISSTI